jgi:hypothetical protein
MFFKRHLVPLHAPLIDFQDIRRPLNVDIDSRREACAFKRVWRLIHSPQLSIIRLADAGVLFDYSYGDWLLHSPEHALKWARPSPCPVDHTPHLN